MRRVTTRDHRHVFRFAVFYLMYLDQRNHIAAWALITGGTEGTSPPEFKAGDANANCPPPQVLSCLKISGTRSLALQLLLFENLSE